MQQPSPINEQRRIPNTGIILVDTVQAGQDILLLQKLQEEAVYGEASTDSASFLADGQKIVWQTWLDLQPPTTIRFPAQQLEQAITNSMRITNTLLVDVAVMPKDDTDMFTLLLDVVFRAGLLVLVTEDIPATKKRITITIANIRHCSQEQAERTTEKIMYDAALLTTMPVAK